MSQMNFAQPEISSEMKCKRKLCAIHQDKNCDMQDLEYSSSSTTQCEMSCMNDYPGNLICKIKLKILIINKVT